MTTKEKNERRAHVFTLRATLRALEGAERIGGGAYESAAKLARDDLRKAIADIEARFPGDE